MSSPSRRLMVSASVLVAVAACLAWSALAQANAFSQVEQTFTNTGTIKACTFSNAELEAALHEAPTYDVEYFGAFTQAIDVAISEQANGRCRSAAALSALAKSAPSVKASFGNLRPPAAVTTTTGGSVPLPLVVAAILVVLCALFGLALTVTRVGGWDPAWAQALRHSWGEAEYRLGGSWADLRDRLTRD